jgi:DNA-binding response OmpR family regulator
MAGHVFRVVGTRPALAGPLLFGRLAGATAGRIAMKAAAARVLVVESDPGIAAVVRHHLELEGFGVLVAAHEVQALALARLSRPDVIVIGVGAHGAGSIPLLRVLRADPNLRAFPVLLVTADADAEAEAAGADRCLLTPVEPRRLAAHVSALHTRTRRAPAAPALVGA